MKHRDLIFILTIAALGLTGCSATPQKAQGRAVLHAEVQEAIAHFKKKDPGIQKFFDESAGYAVLPKVYKGAFWVGGAYGKGQLFDSRGNLYGYCDMTQATIGFSFGGEFFREIIFFREGRDLQNFKAGNFTLSAQATAARISVNPEACTTTGISPSSAGRMASQRGSAS